MIRAAWFAFVATLGLGLLGSGALAADPHATTLQGGGSVTISPPIRIAEAAVSPIIVVEPTSLDFGNICVGQCANLVINISNGVDDPTNILTITDMVVAPDPPFFFPSPPELPFNIPGDGSQRGFTIRFCPSVPGAYFGTLTITAANATNTPLEVQISGTGNTAPICNAGGPYTGNANEPINFDGSGSSDPDQDPILYSWDFGDGSTGTGATPSHTYTGAGLFTVTLTVTDDCGAVTSCETTADVSGGNQAPECDAGGPYNGTAGQPVSFDGTGSNDPDGSIVSYAWNFGDGNTGTGPTPSHTYASPGTFDVSLTVTDDAGAPSTCPTQANITAGNQLPTCDAGGPYNGTAGQPVSFDGSNSSDSDGTIVTYAWNFGDGSTGTGATPSHTYAGAGTFNVSLTVTDNDGGESSCGTTAEIAGTNQSPVCNAGGPYSGDVGESIAFDGSASTDPDGTIATYAWNFGDGSTGTGATPSHTYATAGTFTVSLTVTDNEGAQSSCETSADINDLPVCDAGGPYTGAPGQPINFDGSASNDPDGTIASYAWNFGDGSTGTGATPSHTYAGTGTFNVSLTVTDNDGAQSSCGTTAEVVEGNIPPACDAGGPYTGNVGQPVDFDGSGSNDPDGTIATYAWNFGDGSTGTGATPSHTYATPGTFTVELCVTDNEGAERCCETTAEISIVNEEPICDAGGPYSGTAGVAVDFDGSNSVDVDGTIVSYAWNFGDGSTGTGAMPSHTYAAPGTFTVQLCVTDDDGAEVCCETTADIIEGPNQDPVCDAGGPYSGTPGQPVNFDGTGSTDPDGTIATYAWNFGDGSTGTGATPTHTYAGPGTFTVELCVTDNDGAQSCCETTANISDTPNEDPICDAGGPYTGAPGQPVNFDGTGSTDPDGTIVTYAWDFGDGSTGTGATPTHTYQATGTFTVELCVTDNDGAESCCETTANITGIPNEDPICDAGGPYSGTAGQPVNFDGTDSTDPDGTIVSYDWAFGDGSTGSGATPSHTYASPGVYDVTLLVTDNDGAESRCETTADISGDGGNEDPDCSRARPSRAQLWPPNKHFVEIDILGVTDPDGDPVTITIDEVTQDEPTGTGENNFCPDARFDGDQLELRAERSGGGNGRVYEISFTATDGEGGSCSGTVTVCVPHDQGNGDDCVDSGQTEDSFECGSARADGTPPGAPAFVERGGVQLGAASIASDLFVLDYSLPADGQVHLDIFDVTGRRVATLERSHQSKGAHQVSWNARQLARGVYYARLQAAGVSLSKALLLMR
jgi:PKD repeat protein